MNRLPDASRVWIEQIFSRRRIFQTRASHAQSLIHAIRMLGHEGRIAAIPYFASFLWNPEAGVATAAKAATSQILKSAGALDLIALDRAMRSPWGVTGDLRHPGIDAIPCIDVRVPGNLELLAMASMSRDGRVREAAVEALSRAGDGEAVRYLLIRSNDWVLQVRRAACAGLRQCMAPDHAGAFIDALPLVARLRAQERHRFEPIAREIQDYFRTPAPARLLLAALDHPDRVTRREACSLLLNDPRGPSPEAMNQATYSNDEVLRRSAWTAASRSLPDEHLLPLLVRGTADRSSRIRGASLRELATRFPASARPFIEAGMLDDAESPRRIASFYLKEIFAGCGQAWYRTAVQSSPEGKLAAALHGLAEHGDPADERVFRAHLGDESAAVRWASARGLIARGGSRCVAEVQDLLLDRSSRVRSRIAAALRMHIADCDPESLACLLPQATRHRDYSRILFLLMRTSLWNALELLLKELRRSASGEIGEARTRAIIYALRYSTRRAGKVYTKPQDREASGIRSALAGAEPWIPRDLLYEFRDIMRLRW